MSAPRAARRSEPLLRPRQARYLERLRPPADRVRAEIAREAAAASIPIAHPDTARLVEALAAITPAGRVLELGDVGFATLHLARGAASGQVVAIDPDAGRIERARGWLERAGVAARVELRLGEPLELLPELTAPFDLALISVGAGTARRCLDQVVPLLALGGRVVVDHLLAGGRIAEPAEGADDPLARAAERFNPYFSIHPQLATVVLAVGDGVGLGVKLRPTILEMGGPF